jgi:transcriptional regulator with XRE-family HTH domain
MKLEDDDKTELRLLLKEAGLKQKQLAEMLNVHPQAVNRSLGKGVLTQKFYTLAKAKLIESTKSTKIPTGVTATAIADLAHQIAVLPNKQREDMIIKTMGDVTAERIVYLYRELVECIKPPTSAKSKPAKVDDPIPPTVTASPEI